MKKGLLKQAFAMFLAITMLVTSLPVTAYASTDAEVPVVEETVADATTEVESTVVDSIESVVMSDTDGSGEDEIAEQQPFKILDIELSKQVLIINDKQPTDSLTIRVYTEGYTDQESIWVGFLSDASSYALSTQVKYVEDGLYEGEISISNDTYNTSGEYYLSSVYGPGAASEYYEPLHIRIIKTVSILAADANVKAIELSSETLVNTGMGDSVEVTATTDGGNINTMVEVVYTGVETGDTFTATLGYADEKTYIGEILVNANSTQKEDTYKLTSVLVNGVEKTVEVDSEFAYSCDAANDETNKVIESITLDVSEATLTDENPNVYINMSAKITENAGENLEEITVILKNENNRYIYFYLYNYEEDGIYQGSGNISKYTDVGTYEVYRVILYDTDYNSIEEAYNGEVSFTVKNEITDFDAPVISEVGMYNAAGEKLEAGVLLKNTDTITIKAKVEDDHDISYVTFNLSSSNGRWSQGASFNEETGYYEATIYLENLACTEWSLNNINSSDSFNNYGYQTRGDLYFVVTDEEGTYTPATYNFTLFYINRGMQMYYKNVTLTEKTTSMFDLFEGNVPVPTEYEGTKFIGWDIQNTTEQEVLSENDEFDIVKALNGNSYALIFKPVYENIVVSASIVYWSADGYVRENITIPLDAGTTYAAFVEDFKAGKYYDLSTISHASQLTLEGYTHSANRWYSSNDSVIEVETEFTFTAEYDKIPISVTAKYFNESGQNALANIGQMFLEKGTTYEDLIRTFDPAGVTHNSNVTLEGWNPKPVNTTSITNDQEVVMGPLTMEADYDKVQVTVFYNWYGEGHNQYMYDKEILWVNENTRYCDAINIAGEPENAAHTTLLGAFEGWEVYSVSGFGVFNLKASAEMGSVVIISADYEKQGVDTTYTYINSEGQTKTVRNLVAVEEGTTYVQFYNNYLETELANVEHGKELVEWTYSCGSYYGISPENIISGVTMMRIDPEYSLSASDVTVKNIELSPAKVSLTDSELEKTVTVTLYADVDDAQKEDTWFNLYYENKVNDYEWYGRGIGLNYDKEKDAYVGKITVDYTWRAGEYTLNVLSVNGQEIETDITSKITVEHNNKDKTAPTIQSIQFLDKAGKELKSGVTLNPEDEIIVRVKAKDNKGLNDWGWVQLCTFNENFGQQWYTISLEYNKDKNLYEGVLRASEIAATEWVVNSVCVRDIYGNETFVQSEFAFYVKDENGNCEKAELTYNVYFNMPGYYQVPYQVTTGAVTSLAEMFPDGVPEAPVVEGAKFLGWDLLSTEEVETLSNDDVIILKYNSNQYFTPVYDKVYVDVYVNYWSRNNTREYKYVQVGVKQGTTYETLIKNLEKGKYDLDLDSIKHTKDLKFKDWNYGISDEMMDMPVGSFNTIVVSAQYNKAPVEMHVQYLNEDGYMEYKQINKYVKLGTTYAQLVESLDKDIVDHYEGVTFEGWSTQSLNEYIYQQPIDLRYGGITLLAEYDKIAATIMYNYFSEDEYGISAPYYSEVVLLDKGATYDDAIEASEFEAENNTTSLGKFIGWDYSLDNSNGFEAEVSNGAYIYAKANYEEQGILVNYEYCNKDGVWIWVEDLYTVEEGTTYQDVLDVLGEDLAVAEEDQNATMGFKGWNVEMQGENWGVSLNTEIDGIAVLAIRAQYKDPENISTTVKFDVNGGNALTEEDSAKAVIKGKKLGTLPTVTREGYTFVEWNTEPDGLGDTITNKTKVNYPMTVFAVWKENKYTIKFNANGGKGTMSNLSAKYDTEKELTKNTFKRTGYTFVGWNTKENGTGESYADQDIVLNLTAKSGGSKTLYAQWEAKEYSITYNVDGGTLPEGAVDTYTIATKTFELPKPTKENYTFAGWYTKESLSSKYKVLEIEKGSTGNITLYAKWTPNKYTVKFNANGGTGSMSSMTKLAFDQEYTLTKNAFKKTGYTFAGWKAEINGEEVFFENEGTINGLSTVNDDKITLYAQWKEKEYTITFNSKGGSAVDPITYTISSVISELPTPEKEGYIFAGWYTDKNYKSSTKVTKIKAGTTGNKTLYAKWTAKKYTVVFDANEESLAGYSEVTKTMSNQKITYGKETALTKNAYKAKYFTFKGWATTPDATTAEFTNKQKVKVADLLKLTTADEDGKITLYAVWAPTEYTITYNLGKNMKNVDNTSNPTKYNTMQSVYLNTPTCEGYTFVGWYTDKNCKNPVGTPAIEMKTTENKTFYAKWEIIK